MKLQTTSSIQTKKIAKELAQSILDNSLSSQNSQVRISHNALAITLHGDLGAGKTTFTQGFLRGLGVKSKITSPTFVITKSYKLKAKSYSKVYHYDCYRIKSAKEISDLNWKEIIADPKNIILIEWPERISKILPKNKPPHQFSKNMLSNKKINGESNPVDFSLAIKKYFKNWCGGKIQIIFKHGKKENERELIIQ
jgi:tRNA threonylcarbamoyladenosine biosynthesis protein TsaE